MQVVEVFLPYFVFIHTFRIFTIHPALLVLRLLFLLDFLLDLLFKEDDEISWLDQFLGGGLKLFRGNVKDNGSVGGVVSLIVHKTKSNGRCQSVKGDDKVNPAFLHSRIGLPRGLPRSSSTFGRVVTYIGPSFFFDHVDDRGESL